MRNPRHVLVNRTWFGVLAVVSPQWTGVDVESIFSNEISTLNPPMVVGSGRKSNFARLRSDERSRILNPEIWTRSCGHLGRPLLSLVAGPQITYTVGRPYLLQLPPPYGIVTPVLKVVQSLRTHQREVRDPSRAPSTSGNQALIVSRSEFSCSFPGLMVCEIRSSMKFGERAPGTMFDGWCT
jgi:hypothetical protein